MWQVAELVTASQENTPAAWPHGLSLEVLCGTLECGNAHCGEEGRCTHLVAPSHLLPLTVQACPQGANYPHFRVVWGKWAVLHLIWKGGEKPGSGSAGC